MTQKTRIFILILGLFIASLVFLALFIKIKSYKPQPVLVSPEQISTEELKNYKVPEKGEKLSENVAVPLEVSPAAPGVSSNFRFFEIKIENKTISPKEIIVYQNDIVNLKLAAVDNDYDFNIPAYGISVEFKKGETKTIEFQAMNLGTFAFFCQLCSKKEQGYLIVVPKTQ